MFHKSVIDRGMQSIFLYLSVTHTCFFEGLTNHHNNFYYKQYS